MDLDVLSFINGSALTLLGGWGGFIVGRMTRPRRPGRIEQPIKAASVSKSKAAPIQAELLHTAQIDASRIGFDPEHGVFFDQETGICGLTVGGKPYLIPQHKRTWPPTRPPANMQTSVPTRTPYPGAG